MSTVRAKGQDVLIQVTTPESGLVTLINEGGLLSLDMVFKLKLLEEMMLGETANRLDDIYESTSFEMEGEVSSAGWFAFVTQIMNRARRITPAEAIFSIQVNTQFATGQFGRVLLPDVKFGELPYNVGGRDEYVKIKIQGGCSLPRFI